MARLAASGADPCEKARGERGIYLVTAALWIVGLLTVAAVVVDAGNLYRHRQFAQRAADLGALAGLGLRSEKGWSYFHAGDRSDVGVEGALDDEAAKRAVEVVRANLALHGVPPSAGDIQAKFSSLEDKISVSVQVPVALFFSRLFPSCQDGKCVVAADAAAALNPATVALVLDLSGSMNCPSADSASGTCRCIGENNCVATPADAKRVAALKNAVHQFMGFFNPNRDRATIIPFNVVATVAFPLGKSAGGNTPPLPFGSADPAVYSSNKDRIKSFYKSIDDLTAGGNTNICDGLTVAHTELSAAVAAGGSANFVILFSDGAPTAGRYSFTEVLTGGPVPATAAGSIPLWMGAVQWSEVRASGEVTTGFGPSNLLDISAIPFGYNGGAPYPGATVCGASLPYAGDYYKSVNGCLRSYRFNAYAAAGLSREVSGEGGLSDFTAVAFTRDLMFAQQAYYCAIELSDLLRQSSNSTLFTVGLGVPADNASIDPLQNVADPFKRKDYFLRRLALDRYHGAGDPPFGPRRQVSLNDSSDLGAPGAVTVGYDEYRPYSFFAGSQAHEGSFHGVENPEALKNSFTRIAKDILGRVTK